MIGPRPRLADRIRYFRPGLGTALLLALIATAGWLALQGLADYRALNERIGAAMAERDAFLRAVRP